MTHAGSFGTVTALLQLPQRVRPERADVSNRLLQWGQMTVVMAQAWSWLVHQSEHVAWARSRSFLLHK
jgi:hypothetical protein